jgi:YfiH family protein
MLERITSAEGVVTYVSPLLGGIGVPHAFSTRIGGISPPPFDSLNLGNPSGCAERDDSERIRRNYRLLLRAAECEGRELLALHQVHGGAVIHVKRGLPHDNDIKADALVSDDPARALSVRVADCVPVLLSTGNGCAVAAIHAGWRGVVAGVAVAALEVLRLHGDQVVAAVGPSIGFDAFEVGPEVLDEFVRQFGADALVRWTPDGKGRVDLRECLRRQLVAAGIPDERIDRTDRCTHTHADEFFSHRRDNGITGRMAAIIGPVIS